MLITLETMKKIHDIQIDMMKELIRVMNNLNITYYFVHGSLLGALTRNNFIPEDDDIDIALYRSDYNKLIKEGNHIICKRFFIQNSINDNYPLAFAKMRNNETAFIQPVLKNYKCNQGIYIDIFPIDYEENSIIFKIKERLLNTRINSKLNVEGIVSLKKRIARVISYIVYPNFNQAVKIREDLYTNLKKNDYVRVTNGKLRERNIPSSWFGDGCKLNFCGIIVNCPIELEKYLSKIYGQSYRDYNPAQDRIETSQRIEISASILDLDNSYKHYSDQL